jgi:hypothetical protein
MQKHTNSIVATVFNRDVGDHSVVAADGYGNEVKVNRGSHHTPANAAQCRRPPFNAMYELPTTRISSTTTRVQSWSWSS